MQWRISLRRKLPYCSKQYGSVVDQRWATSHAMSVDASDANNANDERINTGVSPSSYEFMC